ncbi:hypothetical protein [Candidatus Uabimicrobium sp. HlEnr_7]|uniref:hypothetical protein n=1 Tax=Candidatus Uabimicrobium helgolandensis TaxID=3095367 RepID=UPI0035571FB4
MKKITLILLFLSLCLAENHKSQTSKPQSQKSPSLDKVKIWIECQRRFFAQDNIPIKVWAYNGNSIVMPFRYKTFIKINNTTFRTKKSHLSTRVKLLPRKRTLIGTYTQKKAQSGKYRILGFVKLKTRTLKSNIKNVQVSTSIRLKSLEGRNSRLKTRIESRKRTPRTTPREEEEEEHCPPRYYR